MHAHTGLTCLLYLLVYFQDDCIYRYGHGSHCGCFVCSHMCVHNSKCILRENKTTLYYLAMYSHKQTHMVGIIFQFILYPCLLYMLNSSDCVLQLSLAEAKTIWSLLQQNEFFVAVIFRAESHIPSVVDFCGAIYRTEYVNYTKLYEPDNIAMHRRWFGPRFPKWAARAKVVLGLLEFTMEAYQHGSDGSFYMCSTNSTNVGFTDAHDVKLLDTSKLLSHQDLRAFVGGKTCATSADCSYTPHCTTKCDTRAHTCTAELERPNLHLVCRIARPYILKNAPSDLHGSLLRILARCSELSAHLTGVELQHSLVLNDFKSLLWKAIM